MHVQCNVVFRKKIEDLFPGIPVRAGDMIVSGVGPGQDRKETYIQGPGFGLSRPEWRDLEALSGKDNVDVIPTEVEGSHGIPVSTGK